VNAYSKRRLKVGYGEPGVEDRMRLSGRELSYQLGITTVIVLISITAFFPCTTCSRSPS